MAHILVVDDDSISRKILCDILQEEGHDVVEVGDGAEALAAIQKQQPLELVITDIFMPNMQGLELISRLMKEVPGTPMIAITSGASLSAKECLDRARRAGARKTLTKPFDRNDVLQAVSSLVG